MKKWLGLAAVCLTLFTAGCQNQNPSASSAKPVQRQELYLAGGQNGGSVLHTGEALSTLLAKDKPALQVKVLNTNGSVANIELLRQKKADLALVQSDVAYEAQTGSGLFKGRSLKNLQLLGTLFQEPVQILTYDTTRIHTLADLKGKTVGIGAAGSGTEMNARQILWAAGLSYDDLKVQYLSLEDSLKGLKEGTVDAAFVTSAVPTPALQELSRQRRLVFIPVLEPAASRLMQEYPFYSTVIVPAGSYPNQPQPYSTVAVHCVLVATDVLPADKVKVILEGIFAHWPELRLDNPGLSENPSKTFFEERGIPMAPAAETFYLSREKRS